MTTKRVQKKQKLRNAEYYDLQLIQDKLYDQSKKNIVFNNLIELIANEENIKLAYRNLKKNSGSKTAGVDNKTIFDLAKWQDENLINHVKKKLTWYQPQAIKRVEIPKGDSGKTRPLGIPTIVDRLIQQCILQVLEPICEAKFHERSNGFRPNRSTEHALAQCYKYMQVNKLHYVVDIDIKGFFDNVNHGKLLKQLWYLGIRDKKLISILSVMLKAEVASIGFPTKGTPQGGIISPLLSNVVLNELDWWITSQWEDIPTEHNYLKIRKNLKVDKGDKYRALRRTNLKECYIVRYADDFRIFCRNHNDAKRMFVATTKWLKDRLGLDISPDKSKIVNLKKEYSEFLGFRMKLHENGKDAKGNKRFTVKSHISDKAKKRIKSKTKEHIKKIQNPSTRAKGYEAVVNYNAYVLGIHFYYRYATHVSNDFSTIAFSVKKSFGARFKNNLKREGKHLLPVIKERYGASSQIRYVHNTVIAPIGFVQHKNPMFKLLIINKYTAEGREKIHKKLQKVDMDILFYLMRNPVKGQTIEYNDNRLSLYSAQQGNCAITKQPLKIGHMHCHHKIPREFDGLDIYKNLIFLNDVVHKLIHAIREETINKYLEVLKLDVKQMKKVNRLRILAKREELIL
ncbi:MAG: group II intron reverse transcriptase/maturase [Vallitaleaceae bacterium]|nr:group II intron reverse transcriptase/maturase [Vallitaleaceae bacterium]